MDWARLTVRGSPSRLIAVTPAPASWRTRFRLDQRPQHADDRLAVAQPGDQVRPGHADADEDAGPVDRLVPADDFRAGPFVGTVGEARRGTRAGFHEHVHLRAG